MIRCSECDRCKTVSVDYGRKRFHYCAEMGSPLPVPFNTVKCLWKEKPKMHPHWCPKYKEAKKC